MERFAATPQSAQSEAGAPAIPKARDAEIFGMDTEEFKAALQSVPTDLLELISRQFAAEPEELVVEEIIAPPVEADASSDEAFVDDAIPDLSEESEQD